MALTGEFLRADAFRRTNRRFEAAETAQKAEAYEAGFESARAALLAKHADEIQHLRMDQEFEASFLRKRKIEAIEVCIKKVNVLKRLLEEDTQLSNFTARKYKRPPEIVLPLTVTVDGGEDVPPGGTTASVLGDSISRYREVNAFGPLSLPVLKIKRLRHAPRAVVVPKPKPEG
jgi:uncharacterized protein (UPF0332 family)